MFLRCELAWHSVSAHRTNNHEYVPRRSNLNLSFADTAVKIDLLVLKEQRACGRLSLAQVVGFLGNSAFCFESRNTQAFDPRCDKVAYPIQLLNY